MPSARPLHGEAIGDAREDAVAAGVAPEDQIAVGDIGVGDVLIVTHLGVAAKLAMPFGDGALLFGGGPLRDGGRERRAGGRDEDEAIEEGVVDGTLQSVALVQAGDATADSTTVHCAPDLRKCAVQERSEPGTGRSSFWPSMVTTGGARHRAGRRRSPWRG